MQAAQVREFGAPEVLELSQVPDPVPQPGEVLIDVAVSSVLWVETMIRRTGGPPYFNVEPPYIPGNGVGGTVSALGGGVEPEWLGRLVIGHTGGGGGYAEKAVLPVEALSVVPDGVQLDDAVALRSSPACVTSPRSSTQMTPNGRQGSGPR
jgi:NADPH2:quinone reductase